MISVALFELFITLTAYTAAGIAMKRENRIHGNKSVPSEV